MNKLAGLSRNFSSSVTFNAIKNVTVVGAGLMGSGIAQVAAQAGQNVILIDLDHERLDRAQKSIQGNLTRVAKKIHKDDKDKIEGFVKESFERIKVSNKVEDGVNADLIVEAIVEKLDVKQDLFNKLDQLAPEHTILATNTSSISVNAIGAGIKRKDKFGGLHFFNPVPVMRLLEVVKSDHISEETYKAMMEWGRAVGKTCITCKDTPGKEDIDIGMKLGAGYPMGPFELADYTGLDTNKFALQVMYEMTGDAVFRPIPLMDKMVEQGKLGIKTGEGFYKYNVTQDIDTAMRLGAAYPMGPLELADFTGLDLKKYILAIMLEKTGDPVFERIPILDKLVGDGKFGRKSGEGIY
ncbi:putative 3-hydroxyacyl-CoA dehydrogenase, partial [Operophtera brumata]